MEISNSLDSESLINILTLRYDPNIKPNLPIKTWNDFESNNDILNVDKIESSICNSIKHNTQNFEQEKISIALSGGVDSTLVLALLRKTRPNNNIEAVSIKFADSVDETKSASKIAEKFEANHHVVHLENYLSELPKAISIIKLPFWDLHWYYVAKKSQSISRILLSGDGGDELFGGYTFRYKKFLLLTSANSTPLEKVNAYLASHERDRVPDQEHIFAKKCNFSWNFIHSRLVSFFENSLDRLEQVFFADYTGKLLYNFNPLNSRITDYFEIKQLAPLLNSELLSIAPHISLKYKYDQINNIGKLPLRNILETNNASSLTTTEKLGFNVNSIKLWQSHGHDLCSEFFDNSRVVKDGWINNDWIQKYIDKPDLDVRYVNKFFGLLAFEIWYRIFVTKEMSSETTLD